jgi:hypothetical protein
MKVQIGPAIRFRQNAGERPPGKVRGGERGPLVVLVVLPIPPSEVDHMIGMIADACNDPVEEQAVRPSGRPRLPQ